MLLLWSFREKYATKAIQRRTNSFWFIFLSTVQRGQRYGSKITWQLAIFAVFYRKKKKNKDMFYKAQYGEVGGVV